jgi:ABC-type Co2+ transport system permease subunit
MRLAIRELLALVTFTGLGLGGILTGPPVSWVALTAFVLLVQAFAIDAFITTGRRRAFAIGFILPTIGYLVFVFAIGQTEFRAQMGVAPTTQLVQYLLQPRYVFGQSPHSDSVLRQQNALSVIPLGQICVGCILGYVGAWYARWSSRTVASDETGRTK